MHSKAPEVIRHLIRQRANHLCEYCHASEQWQYVRFTVDHVIPVKRGGLSTPMEVRLLNPRQDAWGEHFVWSADGLRIVGRTPTDKATIIALEMNRSWAVNIRAVDRTVGRHPPVDDPIE